MNPFKLLIAVNAAESFDVQQRAFEKGMKWNGGEEHVMHTDKPYIQLDVETGAITWCDREIAGVNKVSYDEFLTIIGVPFSEPVEQSLEELLDENESLDKQITRLEGEVEELLERILRKRKYFHENAASIAEQMPENIGRLIKYVAQD